MQFTVYHNADAATRKAVPYLLDVQSDLIDDLRSRVVVPLIAPARAQLPVSRLMPLLDVLGEPLVMDTPQLAGVPQKALGAPVANLCHERSAILAALDVLISGI
ncbi:MAG: CcdB family protein [Pseudomonas sp.]|nr:CcdB family protein [Pseudomonas sp.]